MLTSAGFFIKRSQFVHNVFKAPLLEFMGLPTRRESLMYIYFHSFLTLYSINIHLMHQQQTAFRKKRKKKKKKNIVGKEEIARYEQFLLFPQCLLLNQIIVPHLSIFLISYFICC